MEVTEYKHIFYNFLYSLENFHINTVLLGSINYILLLNPLPNSATYRHQ